MEEIFNASMNVKYLTDLRQIKIEDLGVAPVVVLTWSRRIMNSVVKKTKAVFCRYWFYGKQQPLYSWGIDEKRFSIALTPLGASGTVCFMEELIACGARDFIGVGSAGGLQPHAPAGALIIPVSAKREEGTSGHYLPHDAAVIPDREIQAILEESCTRLGIKVLKGTVWTTDAPYRELKEKVLRFKNQGILAVDMETSAMYALGMFRNVRVCNLLVISDELGEKWNPAFHHEAFKTSVKNAEDAVIGCLGILTGKESGSQRRNLT